MAGSTNSPSTFPGAGNHGGWEDEDMSVGSGRTQSRNQGGFDYQGKPYDPILNDPMAVSAETHGDFWEDDMDYSETVSYEGVDTRAGAQAKTDEKSCENCPPEGKVMPMVRRCSRWSMVTISYQTRICGTFYNPESWWTGDISAKNQASRHQAVATMNQPLKVVWIFMQPVSYSYFSKIFSQHKDIITRWQP